MLALVITAMASDITRPEAPGKPLGLGRHPVRRLPSGQQASQLTEGAVLQTHRDAHEEFDEEQ